MIISPLEWYSNLTHVPEDWHGAKALPSSHPSSDYIYHLIVSNNAKGEPSAYVYWLPTHCVIFHDYEDNDGEKINWCLDKNLSLLTYGLCRVENENKVMFGAVFKFKEPKHAVFFKLKWIEAK